MEINKGDIFKRKFIDDDSENYLLVEILETKYDQVKIKVLVCNGPYDSIHYEGQKQVWNKNDLKKFYELVLSGKYKEE